MMMERDGRMVLIATTQTAKHDTDAMEASGWSGQGVAAERDCAKERCHGQFFHTFNLCVWCQRCWFEAR